MLSRSRVEYAAKGSSNACVSGVRGSEGRLGTGGMGESDGVRLPK